MAKGACLGLLSCTCPLGGLVQAFRLLLPIFLALAVLLPFLDQLTLQLLGSCCLLACSFLFSVFHGPSPPPPTLPTLAPMFSFAQLFTAFLVPSVQGFFSLSSRGIIFSQHLHVLEVLPVFPHVAPLLAPLAVLL